MIVLLVMTDGRDTIVATIDSFRQQVTGPITHRVIHDDSDNQEYRHFLVETFPDFEVIGGRRTGFGGAISRAWRHVRQLPVDWVFHVEDDFTFNRHIDLTELAGVLTGNPRIVQMALRRQPWAREEAEAGGIVEQFPESYSDCTDGEHHWLEHRRFFTTNPSLYHRNLCDRGWPHGPHSEGRFSADVMADPDATSAYWGCRESGEWVTHIGNERVGRGY